MPVVDITLEEYRRDVAGAIERIKPHGCLNIRRKDGKLHSQVVIPGPVPPCDDPKCEETRLEVEQLRARDVDDRELWLMLLSTVRYAMGRSSYITSTAADLVRQFRSRLTAERVQQIAREVQKDLEIAESTGRTLGHDCDHRGWKKLVEDLTKKGEA